ncbi:hypothetical protein EDC04DRAFT_2614157 [Pisolithus marmoratus]|nr:hypothetical protein EDC04DRAFT_2614157 [Pisolithus marmoratus]
MYALNHFIPAIMVSSQHFNRIVMASLLDIQSKVVGTCMPLLVLLVQRAPNLLLVQCSHISVGGSSAFYDLFLSHYVFLRLAIFPPYATAVSPMFLLSALSICRNNSSIPGWVKWEEDISNNCIVVVE